MAAHLTNPALITREYEVAFTPTGGSKMIIDHGTFSLPGTEAGSVTSYTTDEATYSASTAAAGFSACTVETIVDDNWATWMDYSMQAKPGVLTITPKTGAQSAWEGASYNAQVNGCSEAQFGINDPNIPVYTISFAINSKIS